MASDSSSGNVTGSSGAFSDSGDTGTSSSDQLIPSDSKQKLLPFWIAPASAENIGGPQMFTFRPSEQYEFNTGRLNIMPSDRDEYDNDLGLKYLVSKYVKDGGFGEESEATRDVILNNLPTLRVREYTQDTKLELLWGLLKNGIEGFKAGKDAAEDTQKERLAKTLGITADQATKFAGSMASSIKDPAFWEEVVDEISKTSKLNIQSDFYTNQSIKTKLILELVYALYYRMIGATTTNVYILPFSGNDIIGTNGADGWGGPNSWGGSTSANSIFGKFFNFALGSNVKIVSEPIWGGSSGGGGSGVSVTFSLFNDTYDSAMMNFIFVNTIFP